MTWTLTLESALPHPGCLPSFALAQEKLQRMLANIQAMWLMAYRLSKL